MIREAAVLAGDGQVSEGRELPARAREVLCVRQDGDTYSLRVIPPGDADSTVPDISSTGSV